MHHEAQPGGLVQFRRERPRWRDRLPCEDLVADHVGHDHRIDILLGAEMAGLVAVEVERAEADAVDLHRKSEDRRDTGREHGLGQVHQQPVDRREAARRRTRREPREDRARGQDHDVDGDERAEELEHGSSVSGPRARRGTGPAPANAPSPPGRPRRCSA